MGEPGQAPPFTLFLVGYTPSPEFLSVLHFSTTLLEANGFGVRTVEPALRATARITQHERGVHLFRSLALKEFLEADGVAMMEGWQDDRIATYVRTTAQFIGMPVFALNSWLTFGEGAPGVGTFRGMTFNALPRSSKGSIVDLSRDPDRFDFAWFSEETT